MLAKPSSNPENQDFEPYNFFGFGLNDFDKPHPQAQIGCALSNPIRSGKITNNNSEDSQENQNLSRREMEFVRACSDVQDVCANDAKTLCYYPPYLSKTTLPISQTIDLTFSRMNGDLRLTLTANPDSGLPYGIVARKIVTYLTTYAIVNKTPVVPVRSMRALCKDLGMSTGGKSHQVIDDMLHRLIGATMFVEVKVKKDDEDININRCGILDSIRIEKGGEETNHIALDDKFYQLCEKSAAPLDSRVLEALSSAIQFDVYVFLLARLLSVRQTTRIRWDDFMAQFGINNKNAASTKQKLKKAIDRILIIQPQMKVHYTNDLVILEPSISPIKTKKGAYIIPNTPNDNDD